VDIFCCWNSLGHFDVLKGPVPPAAHIHAVTAFPEDFTNINILNNPVVHVTIVIYDGKSKTPTAAGGRMFASETS